MKKRAQVSIFMIIGIILVIIASLLFFLNLNTSDTKPVHVFSEKDSVQEFVDHCVDKTTKDALILLGMQGGHVFKPEKTLDLDNYFFSYDFYEQDNLLPTKQQIETDLSKYVKQELNNCVNNLDQFASDFEFGELNVNTNINQDRVMVDVDYPIIIKTIDKQEEIKEFDTNVPIRLLYILENVDYILESSKQNIKVDIGLLSEVDLGAEVFYSDDDTMVYVLTDEKSKINNNDYVFIFANKFKQNLAPYLLSLPEQQANIGEEFRFFALAVDPDGDEITYSSDGLNIDPITGIIKYIPVNSGEHSFMVRATDSFGNYDEKQLIIKA